LRHRATLTMIHPVIPNVISVMRMDAVHPEELRKSNKRLKLTHLCACSTVLDACLTTEDGAHVPLRCHNDGVCVNGSNADAPGTFGCVCAPRFTGPTCQQGLG